MKIRPVGAELFHADRQAAERHAEANSRFSQFWELAMKKKGSHRNTMKIFILNRKSF